MAVFGGVVSDELQEVLLLHARREGILLEEDLRELKSPYTLLHLLQGGPDLVHPLHSFEDAVVLGEHAVRLLRTQLQLPAQRPQVSAELVREQQRVLRHVITMNGSQPGMDQAR